MREEEENTRVDDYFSRPALEEKNSQDEKNREN